MASKKVVKDVCDAYECLIRTCSRHRCQYKKSRHTLNWIRVKDECKMYKSRDQWKTFYTPPPRDEFIDGELVIDECEQEGSKEGREEDQQDD